jgi:hypothetical protein
MDQITQGMQRMRLYNQHPAAHLYDAGRRIHPRPRQPQYAMSFQPAYSEWGSEEDYYSKEDYEQLQWPDGYELLE